MGGFGFPQQQLPQDQQDDSNPLMQILAQIYSGQQDQPWSEQIPGGGSSTQMPQQMPRYPNPPARPAASNPQEIPSSASTPMPQQVARSGAPTGMYGNATGQYTGDNKWGQALQAMGNNMSFNSLSPELQFEARKADQIARIKQQELQSAESDRQEQLQMEKNRLDEQKYWHDVQTTAMYGANGIKTQPASGDPVKDDYILKRSQGMLPAQIQADPEHQKIVTFAQQQAADGKTDTGAQADAAFRDIEAKKAQGLPLTPAEVAQDKAYRIQKTLAPIAGANIRVLGMQAARGVQVINPDTAALEEVSMEDINKAIKAGHPYIPAAQGMKAAAVITRLNDIRQATKSVESNIGVLDTAGGADLAAGLADPSMTVTKYLQGQARRGMSDQQKQFVADVFSLREQAMGVRGLMGNTGQGEDIRHAIVDTLPGIASGDSNMAKKQVVNMYKMLDRVKAGVPKLAGAWGAGMETTGEQPGASATAPTSSAPASGGKIKMKGSKGTFWVDPDKQKLFEQNGYQVQP